MKAIARWTGQLLKIFFMRTILKIEDMYVCANIIAISKLAYKVPGTLTGIDRLRNPFEIEMLLISNLILALTA